MRKFLSVCSSISAIIAISGGLFILFSGGRQSAQFAVIPMLLYMGCRGGLRILGPEDT